MIFLGTMMDTVARRLRVTEAKLQRLLAMWGALQGIEVAARGLARFARLTQPGTASRTESM